MQYPTEAGLVGGKFTDGVPPLIPASELLASLWANAITDEIINVQTAAGLTATEGVNNQLVTAIPLIVPGRLIGVQLFPNAGNFTYNSSPGVTSIVGMGIASGGGGAGAPAPTGGANYVSIGGGGGEGARFLFRLTSGFTGGIPVTIAAAALGGNGTTGSGTGYAGQNGNATSFGTIASALGGYGGTCAPNVVGSGSEGYGFGAPQATGGNILNEGGQCSIPGFLLTSGGGASGAGGGRGGGRPVVNATGNGGNATAPGGGGGGAFSCYNFSPAAVNGGNSLPGWLAIWEYE
jgi:hypothetical protein